MDGRKVSKLCNRLNPKLISENTSCISMVNSNRTFLTFLRSRKQPVLGYTVNFRREHGPWRQTDIHPLTGELWLDSSMKCGTNYTIYMTSYNHVGPGHASSVLAAKTLGRVPDIPNPSDLMVVNKVSIPHTAIW